ncbi:MAG TPA: glycosyltransferase family 4 protein [Fibrobacteria bacterium]|nr:glycosyltransferase family 4 protein [Fibrobacteria bacterium]
MRILVLSSVYARHPKDSEVPWMRESVRRLREAGHEVEILAPSWKGLSDHEIDGVRVHRFRYAPTSMEFLTHDEGAPSKTRGRPWLQLLAIPYILSGFIACWKLARRERFDVMHVHWPFPHGLIAQAGRMHGLPVVLNFHGAELLLARRHPWIRPVLRWLLGQSEAVLCNSSFTRDRILALRQVPVELSPYGTTLPEAPAAPRTPRRPQDPFRILFVGRHIERKGIEHLIDSMALLDGDRFTLDIVGHGDRTEALLARAAVTGDPRIRFPGKLSTQDLSRAYAISDVFALPAVVDSKGDTEGLGVVLIEAAETGLALVASEVGGIPDVVLDGQTGILVPPGNPFALAEALRLLADDPALSARLVEGARARTRQFFSWDVVIPHLVGVYGRVLRDPKRRNPAAA